MKNFDSFFKTLVATAATLAMAVLFGGSYAFAEEVGVEYTPITSSLVAPEATNESSSIILVDDSSVSWSAETGLETEVTAVTDVTVEPEASVEIPVIPTEVKEEATPVTDVIIPSVPAEVVPEEPTPVVEVVLPPTPVVEQPKVEIPEEPQPETPTVPVDETPIVPPVIEEPKVEIPEEPQPEAPKPTTPPVVEEPKVEIPVDPQPEVPVVPVQEQPTTPATTTEVQPRRVSLLFTGSLPKTGETANMMVVIAGVVIAMLATILVVCRKENA